MSIVSFIPAGRAGNYLFEMAAAFCFAKEHGLEFSAPKQTSHDFWSPIYLKHLQHPNYNHNDPYTIIREPHFHYTPIPFNESLLGRNILLSGYFQSEKYIGPYRNELLEAMNLPWEMKEDVCSVHARYGDYLTIDGKHIIVDEEYLLKAMALVTEETGVKRFKVFSDDIPLFKGRHGHLYPFEYSTNLEIMQDLIDASCCAHNISSSSTFSWWIYYLNKNPNKIGVFQKLWFQEGWDGANTDDIYPSGIIKL